MQISGFELYYAQILLTEPYTLSFSTVTKIDLFLIRLSLNDGRCGIAEAVPLPGYTQDTKESLFSAFNIIQDRCIGLHTHELEQEFAADLKNDVFALSALLTAAEIAENLIHLPQDIKLPLLAPVSASSHADKVLQKALQLHDQGYQTIKLKTGRNIKDDCTTVQTLLDNLPDQLLLRIDANQGYNYSQAMQLFDVLNHPRNSIIELVEQPLAAQNWEEFHKLSEQVNHVPLMLDESILCDSDIQRASDVGADLVKLKLFKQGGVSRLQILAKQANKLGMQVVLGNGVSSEIGNLIEAAVFINSGLFTGAFEGNGFIKLISPVLSNKPDIDSGHMVWHNSSAATLDKLVDYNFFELVINKTIQN